MPRPGQHDPAARLLVVMPTWFGDCLMATPTLRALRGLYPQAHVAALVREPLVPLLEGLPSLDVVIPYIKKGRGGGLLGTAKKLGKDQYDTAVLLPNSFRAAALAAVAGIPRRVGYDRDGRGVLLTDRLIPRRHGRTFVPVATLDYYLGLARYLGAADPDPHLEITTKPDDDARAAELLQAAKGRPIVLMNPGSEKPEKRWPAERFVQLAARCRQGLDCAVAVTGSPDEREVLAAVTGKAAGEVIDLPKAGMNLRLLKSVMKRAAVLVTNDTGPRHLAAACGTPVVTLFGPTAPAWTEIGFERERQVVAADPQGPDPMRGIGVDEVFDRVAELLQPTPGGGGGGGGAGGEADAPAAPQGAS